MAHSLMRAAARLVTVALTLALLALASPAPASADAAIDQGPGGPILVIAGDTNQFGRYYAEILRNEGLNEFDVSGASSVTPALLAQHGVAILGANPDRQEIAEPVTV